MVSLSNHLPGTNVFKVQTYKNTNAIFRHLNYTHCISQLILFLSIN